jgi:hypothetical protein
MQYFDWAKGGNEQSPLLLAEKCFSQFCSRLIMLGFESHDSSLIGGNVLFLIGPMSVSDELRVDIFSLIYSRATHLKWETSSFLLTKASLASGGARVSSSRHFHTLISVP